MLCHAEKITYEGHIKDIFRKNCSSCHKSSKQKGGLNLMSYSAAIKGSSSGKILESGDENSVLMECILWLDEDTRMPPKKGKLEKTDVELITKWIKGGLLENDKSKKQLDAKKGEDFVVQQVEPGESIMPQYLCIEPFLSYQYTFPIQAVAASPYAPLFAVGAYKQLMLYESDTLDICGILDFSEGQIYDLKFSRDGSLLVGAGGKNGDYGTVAIWDVKSGRRIKSIEHGYDAIMAVDISPDLTLLAMGGSDKKLHIYNLSDGDKLALKGHSSWLSTVNFSPDGKWLATGDQNGQILIWDIELGDKINSLSKHKAEVNALSWRSDSKTLASCSKDSQYIVWEPLEEKPLKQSKAHSSKVINDLNYDKQGQIFTVGNDKTVRVFNTKYKQIHHFKCKDDSGLKVLPFDDYVVVIFRNGVLQKRSIKSKKLELATKVETITLDERIYRSEKHWDALHSELIPKQEKLKKVQVEIQTIQNYPQTIQTLKQKIARLKKHKSLSQENLSKQADAQLSSQMRQSQRELQRQELINLNNQIKQNSQELKKLSEKVKDTKKILTTLNKEKLVHELAIKPLKQALEEIKKQLVRWKAEKINTKRYLKKMEIDKVAKTGARMERLRSNSSQERQGILKKLTSEEEFLLEQYLSTISTLKVNRE